MSLSKFLAVGRSIVGMSHSSPYTVRPDSYLQKFADQRRREGSRQASLKLGALPPVKDEKVLVLAEATIAAVNEKAARTEEQVKKNPQQIVSPFAPYKLEKPPGFWARWNPFRSRKQPAKNPVQAELRLDGVKVIRNDLTDADVEVIAKPTLKAVPVGSSTPAPSPAPSVIIPKKNPFRPEAEGAGPQQPELADTVPTGRTAWGELTAKVFSAKAEH